MRVMLDTNIIVSAGVFGGAWSSAIVMAIADKHSLVLSGAIIDELREVIAQKFPDKNLVLERFLQRLSYEIAYTPADIDDNLYPKIRDKKDYPILASAIIADVDVFITNDKDFDPVDIDRPEIMTPLAFQQKYL